MVVALLERWALGCAGEITVGPGGCTAARPSCRGRRSRAPPHPRSRAGALGRTRRSSRCEPGTAPLCTASGRLRVSCLQPPKHGLGPRRGCCRRRRRSVVRRPRRSPAARPPSRWQRALRRSDYRGSSEGNQDLVPVVRDHVLVLAIADLLGSEALVADGLAVERRAGTRCEHEGEPLPVADVLLAGVGRHPQAGSAEDLVGNR